MQTVEQTKKTKEEKFWEDIEKVKQMDTGRYGMNSGQIIAIADKHENNYINASYDAFCFGFLKGMRFQKNKSNKSKSCTGATRGKRSGK